MNTIESILGMIATEAAEMCEEPPFRRMNKVMPVKSDFKTCMHAEEEKRHLIDWRDCYQCIAELQMQLTIARTYLRELAMADFNDNGDCKKPLAEPIQGRHFTQIAATGLAAASD